MDEERAVGGDPKRLAPTRTDQMQTILGAGGAIGTELARELVRARRPLRLVA